MHNSNQVVIMTSVRKEFNLLEIVRNADMIFTVTCHNVEPTN
jgi:hypothetical protein